MCLLIRTVSQVSDVASCLKYSCILEELDYDLFVSFCNFTCYLYFFLSRRPRIEHEILVSRPRLPKLDQLKWRVDVAISTR